MRSFPVVALSSVLLLAACGQAEQAEPAAPVEEVQAPPPQEVAPDDALYTDVATDAKAADQCDPNAQGEVRLAITGNPGDGFRLIKMCGTTEVTRCYAEIPAGKTKDSCKGGPSPQPAGEMRCILGPKNGNSAAADAPAYNCP